MFTIVPVRHRATELKPGDGVAALLWLPAVGAVLGAVAAVPLGAIRQWAPHAALLGAILAVAALALATRCLHLDGLADTADGLGSRAPAERALRIMKQSDIGPFGVVTVVLVLLADVASLTVLQGGPWTPVAVLATAAATGRVAAVQAAMRGVPAARSSGFGTLVAGGVPVAAAVAWTVAILGLGSGLAAVGDVTFGWMVISQVVAMTVGWRLRAHAVRRLGGMTGDVFGALIEAVTAVVLAGVALW